MVGVRRQLTMYATVVLDSDAVIDSWPRVDDPELEVAITLGCLAQQESVTILVQDDPAVLDRLAHAAAEAAEALRFKVAQADAEQAAEVARAEAPC